VTRINRGNAEAASAIAFFVGVTITLVVGIIFGLPEPAGDENITVALLSFVVAAASALTLLLIYTDP
jgi:low affinity Fe/Cu permease